VTFEHGAARATQPVAMFLKAGRDTEFIRECVFAKPVRVAATGPIFVGIAVVLRPRGAGSNNNGDGEENAANHDTPLLLNSPISWIL
jgi:hypothetical protein